MFAEMFLIAFEPFDEVPTCWKTSSGQLYGWLKDLCERELSVPFDRIRATLDFSWDTDGETTCATGVFGQSFF